MVQIVQILSQATFAPAEKDSSSEVVEQSVMVIGFGFEFKRSRLNSIFKILKH